MRRRVVLAVVGALCAAPGAAAAAIDPASLPPLSPVAPTGLPARLPQLSPLPPSPLPARLPALATVPPASRTMLLSDGQMLSRWAHPRLLASVHTRPSGRAPVFARLRSFTEMGRREVYFGLRTRRADDGRLWAEVRIARRGRAVGWVPRDALGPWTQVTTMLRVDRRTLRATLYRSGRAVWKARVGIGDRASPTPAGTYFVRERIRNRGGSPAYGPWAFGTSAYSRIPDWPKGGVVGIHGTNEPALIPGRPSHGCVRLTNASVSRLARAMPIGTPVQITA